VLVLALLLTGFTAAVWYALSEVVQAMLDQQDRFIQFGNQIADWARAHHLPLPSGGSGYNTMVAFARTTLESLYTVLAYLGSIAVLVLMGLPAVPGFRRKVERELSDEQRDHALDLARRITGAFIAYVRVMLVTSLITGAASGGWALVTGLDLPLTWALLNFLLNFIPIIGNIVGIIPPTAYAFIQFGGWTMPIIVLAGFTVLQVVISNFIQPWLEGQSLSLSPVGVVVAVGFWGWMWGLPGALLAVPLTAAVVIICDRFESARWFAVLLRAEPRRRAGRKS
jgi:AI-2 transport protein TqsA